MTGVVGRDERVDGAGTQPPVTFIEAAADSKLLITASLTIGGFKP